MPDKVYSRNVLHTVAIIGGGPAGLMAAEVISQNNIAVHVYDAMPSVGRKFLMAGKSGLNLTHAEALDVFLTRFGARRQVLEPMLRAFTPTRLREWVQALGIPTFIGSSGRVFPQAMKAAPLLRAWLQRLRAAGVRFHMRHRWLGFTSDRQLRFATPDGDKTVQVAATVLALGGGSWARLGSTGAWVPILQQAGVAVQPLRPANCGFEVGWSEHLRTRFAGAPVKSVLLRCHAATGQVHARRGDFVITDYGIEGSLVYALAAVLRDHIAMTGRPATLELDLLPDWPSERVREQLTQARGKRSLSEHLRRQLGLHGVKTALLYELVDKATLADPARTALAIKALPIMCRAPRPLDEAISTAGGVAFEALDEHLMLRAVPGVFCAGEMLDWEAPTGGYLLSACFASGYAAGNGVVNYLGAGLSEQFGKR